VFDLLMSLSDFQAFKEVMLDYKSQAAAGSAEASMVDAQPTAVGLCLMSGWPRT
jgi:hypothetical protein